MTTMKIRQRFNPETRSSQPFCQEGPFLFQNYFWEFSTLKRAIDELERDVKLALRKINLTEVAALQPYEFAAPLCFKPLVCLVVSLVSWIQDQRFQLEKEKLIEEEDHSKMVSKAQKVLDMREQRKKSGRLACFYHPSIIHSSLHPHVMVCWFAPCRPSRGVRQLGKRGSVARPQAQTHHRCR